MRNGSSYDNPKNNKYGDCRCCSADRQYGLSLGLLYFILRVIDSFANYYMANTGHVMGAKIETDMRRNAYAHLQKLSDSYYNNTKIGQIMGRITNDLFDITEFSHHCPEEFLLLL